MALVSVGLSTASRCVGMGDSRLLWETWQISVHLEIVLLNNVLFIQMPGRNIFLCQQLSSKMPVMPTECAQAWLF